MLSSMETPTGMTVIGPQGQTLRLPRNNTAFNLGREILRQDLPAEQLWAKLKELLADPLQIMVHWCAMFNIKLEDNGETICLQEKWLNKDHWLPLLQRCYITAGSPLPVVRLAQLLGDGAATVNVGAICLHWHELSPKCHRLGIILPRMLPLDSRAGDHITEFAAGTCANLVSYHEFKVNDDATIRPISGISLGPTTEASFTEPVILGANRTYQCQESSPTGWLEDYSFDSLADARKNAADILAAGAVAQIINRITGNSVSLN